MNESRDGYRFGVSTFGSAVAFEVWRGNEEDRTMTAYLARGVATPERLQATFGNFGRVSMHFRRSPGHIVSEVCQGGQRLLKEHGVFVGNLRFQGENGYISVRIHRAKGAITRPTGRCRVRPHDFIRELELLLEPKGLLLAVARDGVDTTALLALEGRKETVFFTIDEESRSKLAINRFATISRRSPLRANEALTTASISPPAPFHGTGRYAAAPDGTTTWSGDLSVNFPGAPRTPITGPQFETFLEVPF